MIGKNRDTVTIAGDYQYKALNEGYRIQRFWHRTKFLAIRKFLPPKPGEFVLDVGCGSGVISCFLGESGANVVGIDSNPDAIRFATKSFASERVSFIESLVDDIMPVDHPVDKIYCLELIEHIHRPQAGRMLDLFHHLLKDGGKVFLTTPNYHSFWPLIEWLLDNSGLVPVMAGHQHVELYHQKNLAVFCREHGFMFNKIATMCLFSPWLALFSNRSAEWMFHKEISFPFCPGLILIAVLEKG